MKTSWNMDEEGVLTLYMTCEGRTDYALGKIAKTMESAKITCNVAGTDESQITLKLDPRPQAARV